MNQLSSTSPDKNLDFPYIVVTGLDKINNIKRHYENYERLNNFILFHL